MKRDHSPENLNPLRLIGNLALNLALAPIYSVFLLICFLISFSPLFPSRIARENFKKRLHLNAVESILATTATLFHYVLVVLEDFIFWPLGLIAIRDNEITHSEIVGASKQASSKSKGLIVLSAHFGNIEITAQSLNSLLCGQVTSEQKIMALAKPSRSPWATKLLAWYRSQRGIEVLWTNRKDLVKAMILALKSGRALALLVDQKPASAGHFIEFFGAQSAFPDGGVEVAARTQSEFVFFTSRRLWPGYYTYEGIHFKATEDKPLNAPQILAGYARWLETVIQISPWQWSWDYKKWSRQPKNEVQT